MLEWPGNTLSNVAGLARARPNRDRFSKPLRLVWRGVWACGRAVRTGLSYAAGVDSEWRRQRGMAPFPLFRWAGGLGILVWTAVGSTGGISGWWHGYAVWLIVAAVTAIGPEIGRLEVGGVKLELLRDTRSELRGLSNQVTQLQIQAASASSTSTSGANVYLQATAPAATEMAVETVRGDVAPKVPAEEVLAKYTNLSPEDAWRPPPPRPSAEALPPRGVPYTPADPDGTVTS
jgi:hypothetical protein